MKVLAFTLLGVALFISTVAAQINLYSKEDIYIVDNDGYSWGVIPPIEPVVNSYYVNKCPVLSHDGEWMVFLRGRANRNLWLVPSAGGTPVKIYEMEQLYKPDGPLEEQHINFASLKVTPDGNEISFVREYHNEELGSFDANPDPSIGSPRNILYSIWTLNLSTREVKEIVSNGRYHDWSADGRYISYINIDPRAYYDPDNAEHHCAPTVYDTQTGETRYLTDENWNQNMLNQTSIIIPYIGTTFSPDGSNIIAGKIIDGYRQLVKIPIEGGEPEQITFIPHDALNFPLYGSIMPEYSPDGKWILFNIDLSMVLMNTQDGEIYDLITRKKFERSVWPIETPICDIHMAFNYSWSFDGKKIPYNLSVDRQQATGLTHIAVYDFEPRLYEKTITSVEEIQPDEFSITGNYPNPFNPTTTIDFSLSEAGQASLTVFNANGQKMRELVSGNLTAGRHSVVWDGRDQNGKSVSSGVYITRLMMRDKVTTGQMMLLK